jgi:phosphoserine phosphatase
MTEPGTGAGTVGSQDGSIERQARRKAERSAGDVGRPAVCLDLDGTVYPGSAFVTALVLLPWYLDVDATDAAALREAVAAVARHRDGRTAERRFRRLGLAIDVVRRRVNDQVALNVTRGLLALAPRERTSEADAPDGDGSAEEGRSAMPAVDGPQGTDAEESADRIDYARMRRRMLEAYGAFLKGRRVDDVRGGVRRLVARHLAVDPAWARVCSRFERGGGTVYVVTDAPSHLARAYAEKLGTSAATVHGTRFRTDEAGQRYDGHYEPVSKGQVVTSIRAKGPHDTVVAAGDSAADLGMLEAADRFLAVRPEADLRRALAARDDVVDAAAFLGGGGWNRRGDSESGLGRPVRDGRPGPAVVRVDGDHPGELVEMVLDEWGLLAPSRS